MKRYGVFIGLGLELTALVFLGVWVGDWLEKKYPAKGLILVACLMISFVIWTIRIVISLRKVPQIDEPSPEKNLADKETKL